MKVSHRDDLHKLWVHSKANRNNETRSQQWQEAGSGSTFTSRDRNRGLSWGRYQGITRSWSTEKTDIAQDN